jgi:thioredoxin-dependent peroxiredoxin
MLDVCYICINKQFKATMAKTKLGENVVEIDGDLPLVGSPAPDFKLTATDFKEYAPKDFLGKNVILNIFPSIDTRVCATSVREFNKLATSIPNTVVLSISKDLPFAHRRFCAAEGIENVIPLSDFLNKGFSKNYGVLMTTGGFTGLHARAIVVIDPNGIIKHTELVPVIGQEPNYQAAVESITK